MTVSVLTPANGCCELWGGCDKQLRCWEGRGPPPAEDRRAGGSPLNVDCLIIQDNRSPWLFKHGTASSSRAFIILMSHLKTQRLLAVLQIPRRKLWQGNLLHVKGPFFSFQLTPHFVPSSLFALLFLPSFLLPMSWEYQANVRLGRKALEPLPPPYMFDVHECLGGVLAASGEVCVLSEAFLLQFSVAELQMKPLFYYSKKKGNSWFYRMGPTTWTACR